MVSHLVFPAVAPDATAHKPRASSDCQHNYPACVCHQQPRLTSPLRGLGLNTAPVPPARACGRQQQQSRCFIEPTLASLVQSRAHGPRPPTHDLRPTTYDQRPLTHDPRPTTYDPRPTTPDLRPTTHDPRTPTHDPRPTTHDPRPTTHDPRPPTYDQRPTTPEPRPTTHDLRPTTHSADEDSRRMIITGPTSSGQWERDLCPCNGTVPRLGEI
ncbi:uncharacterized protein [Penaeus vannamei]|uniref:uncharacterized protein n=1 Tax=Penaeus vannamei TaxID=6689 RepID=UPI00387F83C1